MLWVHLLPILDIDMHSDRKIFNRVPKYCGSVLKKNVNYFLYIMCDMKCMKSNSESCLVVSNFASPWTVVHEILLSTEY